MTNTEQFPFISADTTLGEAGFRPYIPIQLINQQSTVTNSALLDTGATVNVLPYPVGVELGYVWERQTAAINLTGNLAQYEARVLVVQAVIGQFEPVQLVFAWTKAVQENPKGTNKQSTNVQPLANWDITTWNIRLKS